MNLLNTLYVLTPGSFVRKEGQSLLVSKDREILLRVPVHMLSAVACFGRVGMSAAAMELARGNGVEVCFLSPSGRLQARVDPVGGPGELLRRAQIHGSEEGDRVLSVCRSIVAGKLANSKTVLLRGARERAGDDARQTMLREAAQRISRLGPSLESASKPNEVRGYEGEGAALYFGAWPSLLSEDGFWHGRRSRRPPRDPANALLSFVYGLLLADCVAAASAVGLDPRIGFLHAGRPGRPSLGLDLMEELRPAFADRLVVAMVNRHQVGLSDFRVDPTGGVTIAESCRKTVVAAYQSRKADEVRHAYLDQKVPWGMVPHLQARLLARHLRGDLAAYAPFLLR